MDPLSLLREFNVNKQTDRVVVEGDRVNFGDRYEFPIYSYTAFKQTGSGGYYTLETVLFFLKNRELPTAQYITAAKAQGVQSVYVVDRKQLLEYLDGKVDASSLQQITAPELVPIAIAPQDAEGLERPLKKARTQEEEEDDENTALRVLLAQERKLRDRNTVLIAPSRDFTSVLQVLETAEMQKRHRQHSHHHHPPSRDKHHHTHHTATVPQHPPPPRSPPPQPHQQQQRHPAQKRPAEVVPQALPIKPSARFERDTANDQLKAMGGAAAVGLGKMLNLYGSAAGSRGQTNGAAAPSAPPPPGPPTHRPAQAPAAKPSAAPSSSHQHHRAAHADHHRDSKQGAIPIILVPAGYSTLINMHNAAQFLEQGSFVTWEKARELNPNKPSFAVINRTAHRPKPVPYHITDKVPDRKSSDWQRVVAVIALGAKWQFKDFPFKGAAEGELVETFTHVCGIFMHYHDEKLPDTVKSWNVKRLPIHRVNRHLDMTAMLELYKHLDAFLIGRKSQLAY